MLKSITNTGYYLHEKVVPSDELPHLIESCKVLMSTDNYWGALPQDVCADEYISYHLFNDNVLSAITDILGPSPILMPSVTIRKNIYVDWHIDGAFRHGLGGIKDEPEFVQCAIYLQDNDEKLGGGLSIVKNSHKRIELDGIEYAPATCLNILGESEIIQSKAGDMVVWDARLLHASTPLKDKNIARDRFGLFLSFSKNEANYRHFYEHLRKRSTEIRTDKDFRENIRYLKSLELKPNDFSNSALMFLKKYNVKLAQGKNRNCISF